MDKILIIGQALPVKEQKLPYDSTLLYTMLEWVGVSKSKAQELFLFDALSNTFPGISKSKGHKRPSKKDVVEHELVIISKIESSKKVILLGRMACGEHSLNSNFFSESVCRINVNKECLCLPHPSRRNYNLIVKNRDIIASKLQNFLFN